ncbi:MAG TPA: zf-TFIIB domain-containing protein [Thermoanaerobaculia bacterium]|jgi:hypothetical protein
MSDLDKPSKAEDEYFARQEIERRKRWAQEQSQQMASGEKERLKELHFMKCPKCGMDLATIELHGVKVDQCGNCGGVFFDSGEVDQLLEADRKDQGVFGRVFSIFK